MLRTRLEQVDNEGWEWEDKGVLDPGQWRDGINCMVRNSSKTLLITTPPSN